MLFNLPRAQEFLSRYNVDALIATSPVNITYFTDYFCWLDPLFKQYMMIPGASSDLEQRFALFPRSGEPTLIISPIMAVNALDLWVKDLRYFGGTGLDFSLLSQAVLETLSLEERTLAEQMRQPSPYKTAVDALVSLLKERGLENARIGIELDGLPRSTRISLVEALPQAVFLDASNLIRLIRAVKSPDEIKRLARAAEISEIAGTECLSFAFPGRSISDVIRQYRIRIAEMGAEPDHFAYSINGLGIATEPDYILSEDDILYIDFGCLYQHYFSDTGMTLVMGKLSPVMEQRHAALHDCIDAALEVMSPGVRPSTLQKRMWNTLTQHGITASFPHGHGLGLEIRDYPIIVADNGLRIVDDCISTPSDLLLEENMVLNLEVSIFMPGSGSLHIEKTFVVTQTGNRPLTAQNRAIPFYPGAFH